MSWPTVGDHVLCADGLHMRVVWVAPEPLDVFLCETFHRKDGEQRRAFRTKSRGKEWFPSDAKGRKGIGDPTKRGVERFNSMHPWEQAEMYRRILKACDIEEDAK